MRRENNKKENKIERTRLKERELENKR
jgi:hypothetical protein